MWSTSVARPGSSPLARGLLRGVSPHTLTGRIIPARAGFTDFHGRHDVASAGSSPLARGLRRQSHVRQRGNGIIPARAGFTLLPPATARPRPDHPRSRGVYNDVPLSIRSARGSSPLARGLPSQTSVRLPADRIIPARAGFTFLTLFQFVGKRDHPRSRGVYRASGTEGASVPGSSPLARGLPRLRRPYRRRRWIIPARAGFTKTRCHRSGRTSDHPRSRGVYSTVRSV